MAVMPAAAAGVVPGFALLILLSGDLYRSVWVIYWGVPEAQRTTPRLEGHGWNVRLMTGTDGWARTPRRALPRRLPMSARTCVSSGALPGSDPAAFRWRARCATGGRGEAPVQVHEVWARGVSAGVSGATSRYPIVGREHIALAPGATTPVPSPTSRGTETRRVFNAHLRVCTSGRRVAALEEGVPDAEGRQRICRGCGRLIPSGSPR